MSNIQNTLILYISSVHFGR